MSRALMVFRRDLRLEDNTALNAACAEHDEVFLAFCVDPRQVGEGNIYRGNHSLRFLYESLIALTESVRERSGRLSILSGVAEEEIPRRAKEGGIEAIYFNKDYTSFSLARDQKLEENARALGVRVSSFDDVLLNPPGSVMNASGKPFAVFTRFYMAARVRPVARPVTGNFTALSVQALAGDRSFEELEVLLGVQVVGGELGTRGGRPEALALLESAGKLVNYTDTRDYPAQAGTSRLSGHVKFGTVSPREVYWSLRDALTSAHEALTRQLYWRDFFTHVAYFHPRVYGHAYQESFDTLAWDTSEEKFEAWKEGRTGFPIVDAGMRELRATGFMHNRVRMITASFLTKDLHINWLEGEKYFAQQLSDYDPAINNGNWQWVAGTGCDAQPWFRIFNPWLQQKKFDPDCEYIKQWIPELREVSVKAIHAWNEVVHTYSDTRYPTPIVVHAEEVLETKRRYGKR